MPRYTPKHRAAGHSLRDALVPDALAGTPRTASRAAVSAVVALPLAAMALGGGSPAYADETAGTTAASQSASFLVRPDGSTALPPSYADLRTLVPGAQAETVELAPQPGLAVRGGMELEPRTTSPSRSSVRDAAGPEIAQPKVEDKRWAREDVNLRLGPGKRFKAVGDLGFRDGIGVTGLSSGAWLQVKREGRSMWVHRAFIAKNRPPKPEPVVVETPESTSSSSGSASSGSSAPAASSGVCSNGTSVSGGANVLAVHNAICAAFPSITSYGTYRADSEYHASGRAIDAMVSGDLGWQVAEYVRANAGSLGVSEVIYAQQIWTVERSSEGWRYMEDRGSATANHFDHVHVTTY